MHAPSEKFSTSRNLSYQPYERMLNKYATGMKIKVGQNTYPCKSLLWRMASYVWCGINSGNNVIKVHKYYADILEFNC